MVHLVTNRRKSDILNYLEIFLKNKAPDCIIYSEDGVGGVICGIYFPMFKRRAWSESDVVANVDRIQA